MLTPEEMETKRLALEQKRQERRRQRRRKVLYYFLCTLIGLTLLVATAYWSYSSRIPSAAGPGSHLTSILVLGADKGLQGGTRTDTMMLFSIDRRDGSVGALSIPRDTRVQIPGRQGLDRINAAHAYGGPRLAVATVEQLLNVKIDYFVTLDYDGFERIVDTLGGVVMEIDRPMYYVDTAQDLYIDLRPGVQRLSGEQALQFVRYRGDRLGDVARVDGSEGEYAGRVDRQQKFVQALMKQAIRAQTLLRAPELISELRGAVNTNLTTDEAIRLALTVKDLQAHQIDTAILPGVGETVGGASYWVVDLPKAREVVNRVILKREDMVRVEVLNGNGRAGTASEIADVLRTKGFHVVAVRNADHFSYSETAIISHRGDLDRASEVARALGWDVADKVINAGVVDTEVTDADVTVIVGSDFQHLAGL